jgi:hypothetical protein
MTGAAALSKLRIGQRLISLITSFPAIRPGRGRRLVGVMRIVQVFAQPVATRLPVRVATRLVEGDQVHL